MAFRPLTSQGVTPNESSNLASTSSILLLASNSGSATSRPQIS
jgi:hypothetical protein